MAVIAAAAVAVRLLWRAARRVTTAERPVPQEVLDYGDPPPAGPSAGWQVLGRWWAAEVVSVAVLGTVLFPPAGFLLGPAAALGPFFLYWVSEASLAAALAQAGLLGVLVLLYGRYQTRALLVVNVLYSLWWLACGLLGAFTGV